MQKEMSQHWFSTPGLWKHNSQSQFAESQNAESFSFCIYFSCNSSLCPGLEYELKNYILHRLSIFLARSFCDL